MIPAAKSSYGIDNIKWVGAAVRCRYRRRMTLISFKRHRFPPVIIQHAVWLYARFTLSFCDVEELLAERGIDVSNETVSLPEIRFEHRHDGVRRV